MLGRKLVLIAAAVALAVAQVSAAPQGSHVKISVGHHQKVTKDHEDLDIEVVADSNSTAAVGDEETVELCLPGYTEVSVEGVDGIFCAEGQICVADIKDGACPSAQHELPYGSHCGVVKTGVYGCIPNAEEDSDDSEESAPATCTGEGESPMSVEGVEGIFCVTGQACVADIKDGACPEAQDGLEYGAYCGKVKTGVYGCKPATEEMYNTGTYGDDEGEEEDAEVHVDIDICTGEGESPMSVEGVEGIFCVSGQACVADIKDGACPEAQEGLEYGSYCGTVKTGVYGCKPKSKDQHENEHAPVEEPEANPALCSGEDESPMSVEGVEGIFCVTGQACVADIEDGACPAKQEGLPYGSHCGKVQTGVYGCKPNEEGDDDDDSEEDSDDSEESSPAVCSGEGESPMSVEGVEGIFCVTGQACVADIKDGACPGPQDGLPNGAECGVVASGVYGCKPKSAKHFRASAKKSHSVKKSHKVTKNHHEECTGKDESPMSVEGVEGVFCVTGQACVADIKDGACPAKQEGLPYGAVCSIVKTGVYGCKPAQEEAAPAPADDCNGEGESPMSVEGVEGVFCVTGQACVADIKDGACPAAQDGLKYGSYCGKVKTGVYGCKPNSAKSVKKGHSIKVVKAHATKKHASTKQTPKKHTSTKKHTATKKHSTTKKH